MTNEKRDRLLEAYIDFIQNVGISRKENGSLDFLNKELLDFYKTIKADLKRLKQLDKYLVKWKELLSHDGLNTKTMVRNDIQYLLKEKEGK